MFFVVHREGGRTEILFNLSAVKRQNFIRPLGKKELRSYG